MEFFDDPGSSRTGPLDLTLSRDLQNMWTRTHSSASTAEAQEDAKRPTSTQEYILIALFATLSLVCLKCFCNLAMNSENQIKNFRRNLDDDRDITYGLLYFILSELSHLSYAGNELTFLAQIQCSIYSCCK